MNIIKILPFVSKQCAIKFIEFLPSIVSISETVEKFVSYYYKTFHEKYLIEDWNVEGKPLCDLATNNVNESFNRKLNSQIQKKSISEAIFKLYSKFGK